jgi:hypothetical protein
MSEAKANR